MLNLVLVGKYGKSDIMAITQNETAMLVLLGIGLLYLKGNNHDVTMNDVTDENDKGVLIFLGILAFAALT